MTVSTMIFTALLAMSGVAQQAAPVAAETSVAEPTAPSRTFDLARLKIDQCSGERFDFGANAQTKVGLCGKAGASKEEIAAMLQSAIDQLQSSDRMRAEPRDQIVAQIRAKLAEVQAR